MEKIRPLNKSEEKMIYDTSFHGSTFMASVADIEAIIGKAVYVENEECDKTNFKWHCGIESDENNNIIPFAIYDWKYYCSPSYNERIEWNVGGRNKEESDKACSIIKQLLD